jgi:outer membrane protein OmpA-like peptidoglycan-associated protein
VEPEITVVQTAGTTDETDVSIVGHAEELIRHVAATNGRLGLVQVDGDGTTQVTSHDLTPRDSRGTELRPVHRREAATSALIADLTRTMNTFDTTVPGRSILAGLQAVPASSSGPVLVFSSALDTHDPMSMISLGFDVAPAAVVQQLRTANELPTTLRGRDLVFVLTPVTGTQKALRQPQTTYLEGLLTAIAEAAGASHVDFIVGQGGLPAGTGGTAPVVPIPEPIDTLRGRTTTGTSQDGAPTVITQCVLPSALLFERDSSRLLNERDARRALANCLRPITAETTVAVDGHTACRNAPDSDPAYAKRLSEQRARRIVDILLDLGVHPKQIRSHGWGDTKPLVRPCSDPANRATVVTITTPKKADQ